MSVPTGIRFEERYNDDSGVEFAVRAEVDALERTTGDMGFVEFEHIDKVSFPLARLDWLIEALTYIRRELGVDSVAN